MSKKNVKVFKIILMCIVLMIMIGLIIYLVPVMKNLSTNDGKIAFKEKIENMGSLGIILL